jgi:hypothetical protein
LHRRPTLPHSAPSSKSPHHAVAVQVDPFGKQVLKPVSHFIGSRVKAPSKQLDSFNFCQLGGFNLYSPATPPRPARALSPSRLRRTCAWRPRRLSCSASGAAAAARKPPAGRATRRPLPRTPGKPRPVGLHSLPGVRLVVWTTILLSSIEPCFDHTPY